MGCEFQRFSGWQFKLSDCRFMAVPEALIGLPDVSTIASVVLPITVSEADSCQNHFQSTVAAPGASRECRRAFALREAFYCNVAWKNCTTLALNCS
jgi:hypothetical protein